MRRGGCPRRDIALQLRYPNFTRDNLMKIYFQKKKELSKRILENIKDPECKNKVIEYLDLF